MKVAILGHDEFSAYQQRVATIFDAWRTTHEPTLMGLETGANPKNIIRSLSEDLLVCFADLPLLDRYDVYQRLMDYWDEVMQDDVYLIATDGWIEAAQTARHH